MNEKPFLQLGGDPQNSTPVAIVRGGKDDGKLLFLCGVIPKKAEITAVEKRQLNKLLRDSRGNTKEENMKIKELKDALRCDDLKILSPFLDAMRGIESRSREINIIGGELEPIPSEDGRECGYCAAPSGSGKSFWVGKYARAYNKMFPNNKIILISKVTDDSSLKGIENVIPIEINHDLVSDPIDATELKNTLVIFDDTDTIKDKDIRNAINALKGDLLETGRHSNVYVMITSHLISNYGETRKVLNESHFITVYPQSGSTHQIRALLKNYFGMDRHAIDETLSLESRWITLKRHFPQMLIYEHGAYILAK